MALPVHSGPRPLIQFHSHFLADGKTPWTRDQPAAKPLTEHRATQTQNRRIYKINIHALNGIRTHDPSVRASEESSCFRPRGYCGRLTSWKLQNVKMNRKHSNIFRNATAVTINSECGKDSRAFPFPATVNRGQS
jgi:hypothetical protein